MIKYKYEILPVLGLDMDGFDGFVNQMKNLGYNGFELKAIDNGLAFFAKPIEIPDREVKEEKQKKLITLDSPAPEITTNTPMRPVDEREWIIQLMYKHKFSRKEAAKEFGTTERTFYRLMDKHGLCHMFARSKSKRNTHK